MAWGGLQHWNSPQGPPKSKPWIRSILRSVPLALSPAKNSCSHGHFDLLIDNTPSNWFSSPSFTLSPTDAGLSLQTQSSCEEETPMGSQRSPVSERLRRNLFKSSERKDGGVWISIFNHFIRSEPFIAGEGRYKWGVFTSFNVLPQCRPSNRCSRIYGKINSNTWIIFSDPKQNDWSALWRPFPQWPGLTLHQLSSAQAFVFTAWGEDWRTGLSLRLCLSYCKMFKWTFMQPSIGSIDCNY